jgi:hypothetical protein
VFLLVFRSVVPVSFEVESLTVVSRLAEKDWKRMAQIFLVAGILGALIDTFKENRIIGSASIVVAAIIVSRFVAFKPIVSGARPEKVGLHKYRLFGHSTRSSPT